MYINPYKLLGITAENLSDVDSATINKAKRKLIAEIELSETNAIVHSGVELNKGDCLKAIDDLDNNNKREFHLFILQNKPLNNFLTSRDLTFFTQFKVESIYKDNEFLDFISPYFSEQYDKALIINYKSNKINNLNALLSVKPITNSEYYERCYKSTYAFLRDINNDIEKINKDIENESSLFISQNFKGLSQTVSNKINVLLLNALPSYFQSIRNQIAHSIRDIEVKLYNDPYNNYTTAFQLIEFAKSINSDGLALQTITKSYYTVKKQYENCQSQTPISTNTSTTIQDEEDVIEEEIEQEIKKENKKKKNNYIFSLSIIAVLIIGFFYRPLQYFVLSIQIIIIVAGLLISLKKRDDNISYTKLFKNVVLLIVGGILGLFFPFVARIFISYYVLMFSAEFISELFPKNETKKRKSWGFYPYLIGAIIITFLYHNYSGTTNNIFSSEKNNTEEKLTEKDYFQTGETFFKQSNWVQAISNYTEAIKINPNYTNAYIARGASKANNGQYEEAIIDYKKAEELGYNNSLLYSNLGISYYGLKQSDSALSNFEKALILDSTNANAYKFRGDIKYDKNDNNGAVADYSLAIKYNPNASNYFARGLGYYYLKNYKKAIDDMDKAIELNPNAAQYYYDRGDTKEKNNDIPGACVDWKMANSKGYSVPEYKLNMCIPKVIVMENGNIAGCNFRPIYASPSIDNRLKIKVGKTDVAVKLINVQTGKCIRFVFINQYTTYSITNIPEGKYFMKIAYGNEWGKTSMETNCQGRFTKNTLFKKSDKILDFNLVTTNDGWQVPSFELELEVVTTDGNDFNQFNSSNILENDFYKD